MRFLHRTIHSFEDVARNFEQLEQQNMYSGRGTPTFTPDGKAVSFYFRTDSPTVVNQRIYIFTGSAWTGIV